MVLRGFSPFWLPENSDIDPRLGSHTDLSIFVYERYIVAAAYLKENAELVKLLTNRGYIISFSSASQGKAYPNDINLCATVIGKFLLHNTAYTDTLINEIQNLIPIHVNQGYARCTALAVDKNSIITSDNGIAAAAKRNGLDVLLIEAGGITLEGFDMGFIGGAAFKSGNKIYFTGDINSHPNVEAIVEFLKERNIEYDCLSEGELFDIGGAIVLN